jgi:predicted CXXCH cytochrome family protein
MKSKLLLIFINIVLASTFAFSQNYYLGVGTPADPQNTSCASCHYDGGIGQPIYEEWNQTKHSWAQDSLVSNPGFGYSCLGCHNTGWDLTVANYGADDYVQHDSGNTYSITDQTNFDRVKNIGCETCHGPFGRADRTMGADHWIDSLNTPNYSAALCGSCHQGAHHPYYEEWQQSGHALSANQAFVVNNPQCVRCHVAQSFVKYAEDPAGYVPEILVTGDDIQPLTCVTCHDPHSDENMAQLRFPITSTHTICDECHTSEIDTVNLEEQPHHATSECLSGSDNFGFRYPGQTYQNSAHTYAAQERCVNCHVFSTTTGGVTSTGHSFFPKVEACANCHADYYTVVDTSNHEKMFDYRGTQTRTDSLMNVLQTKLDAATSQDSTTQEFLEARYNMWSADAEGSHGIHNTRLVQKLLRDAIAMFNPTDVAADEAIPTQFDMSQNYPNPFNPSTQIKFSIPVAANVSIIIYDAIGKEVAVLVNDFKNPGSYSVSWNASSFSSGVYFYRLQTNQTSIVKKMLLIK